MTISVDDDRIFDDSIGHTKKPELLWGSGGVRSLNSNGVGCTTHARRAMALVPWHALPMRNVDRPAGFAV